MNVLCHVHPRTASTSLLQYLQENAPEDSGHLHHCHFLIDRRHKWFSKSGYQMVTGHVGKQNYKVITIVRDPVAINLSAFWAWSARHIYRNGQIDFDEAIRFFLDTQDHRSPIHHLSSEVEPFWDLDVFSKPWADPYMIVDDKLLILKFERIQIWPEAIEHFLGIPQAPFPHVNASTKRLELPMTDAYLRGLYRSRHVEKFYTEAEVNQFVERHGGAPYKRIIGEKYVKVLRRSDVPGVFQPVRIIKDEAELNEIEIRGEVRIQGPHAKPYSEIEP